METTGAKSKARVPPTLPPRRGQVKIRIFKTIFKSMATLACCSSGGSARLKNGRDRPPVSSASTRPPILSGYNTLDLTISKNAGTWHPMSSVSEAICNGVSGVPSAAPEG